MQMTKNKKEKLIEVKNIDIVFGQGKKQFKAVDNVSFDIYKGETFGLVGESGSGKTTIGRAIMRINPITNGEILFHGTPINGRISSAWDREITQKIQMIFQDPGASLNERAKVDYIVSEGLINNKRYSNEQERIDKVKKHYWKSDCCRNLLLVSRMSFPAGSVNGSALPELLLWNRNLS